MIKVQSKMLSKISEYVRKHRAEKDIKKRRDVLRYEKSNKVYQEPDA